MFDFGFSEMLIIGVVALVILGPERLPQVARSTGEWLGKAQRFVNQVKSDINRETELSELKRIQEEAQALVHDVKKTVQESATKLEKDVNEATESLETAVGKAQESFDSLKDEASQKHSPAQSPALTAPSADPTPAPVQQEPVITATKAEAPRPEVKKIDMPSNDEIADFYGWNDDSNDTKVSEDHSAVATEPKDKDLSVEALACEVKELRKELEMLGAPKVSRNQRSYSARARSHRMRIYR